MTMRMVLTAFLCVLFVPACSAEKESSLKPPAYNACVNGYLIEAAEKVGVPTDRKPTEAEMRNVQAEVDRKCGHLK